MLECRTFEEVLIEDLHKNPELCDMYLESVIEEYNEHLDKRDLLSALRQISETEGISKTARKAGLSRETFYKSLSPKGNPRIDTLFAIFKALGCKLSITFDQKTT